MDEIWELFDEKGEPTGIKWKRSDADSIPKGLYYMVVGIWTATSEKKLLITLRAPGKAFPLTWENSGGAAQFGETSRQAAVRELFEETGIKAQEGELIFLNRNFDKNRFIDNYLLKRDITLDDVTLLEGENCDKRLITLTELDAIAADGSLAAPIAYRLSLFRKKLEEYINDPGI